MRWFRKCHIDLTKCWDGVRFSRFDQYLFSLIVSPANFLATITYGFAYLSCIIFSEEIIVRIIGTKYIHMSTKTVSISDSVFAII